MHYDRPRKQIFEDDYLPMIPIGDSFTTTQCFNWFQRDYPLFTKASIQWLLRHLSDKPPKVLDHYRPPVLKSLGASQWQRIM